MDIVAQNPLVQFDTSASAVPAKISYNVPEGVFHSGCHYIELPFSASIFKPAAQQLTYKLPPVSPTTDSYLYDGMQAGFVSNVPCTEGVVPPKPALDWYFPGVPLDLVGRLKLYPPPDGGNYVFKVVAGVNEDGSPILIDYTGVYLDDNGRRSIERLSVELQTLTISEITSALKQGKYLRIYEDGLGKYTYTFIPAAPTPQPRLAIVEEYRLTSFLGNYGVGRTLKTLSLLPGEKTRITIKSYTRTTETVKEASSIFDSATEESADDFQETVESESTDKSTSARSDEWQVDAKVTGRWGVGKASVGGGAAGSASSAREQFSKGVQGAAKKHADKASSRRNVSVEQTTETRTESGEETGSVREIQNINVGRTLNFVFRQLNQEYISLLHLVDVRIAFANGMPGADRIVPLAELDNLLSSVIADGPAVDLEANRRMVRDSILNQLNCVIDHQGIARSIYETRPVVVGGVTQGSYYRVKRELSTFQDAITGSTFRVPGIIVATQKNVLRTDGVIVETLLGRANGLDVYSAALQQQAVDGKGAANTAAANAVALELAKQNIVSQKQTAAAQAFAVMFPPPPPPVVTTTTPGTGTGGTGTTP